MSDFVNVQALKEEEPLFDMLQQKALDSIRELSGDVWTDYAPHDPGITTLDVLNYALSELDYQMKFPLEQYLSGSDNRFTPKDFGLFDSQFVFSMQPVTPEDYKEKLLSQVEDVLDVRFQPLVSKGGREGWFDIAIELASSTGKEYSEQRKNDIETDIERFYHLNRNLGENLHDIHFVERSLLFLFGDIDIDGTVSPETILMTLYTEAMNLFTPGNYYPEKKLPIYKLFKKIKEIPGVLSIRSLRFEGMEDDKYAYSLALSSPDQVKVRLFQNGRQAEANLTRIINRLHFGRNLRHAFQERGKADDSMVINSRHIHLSTYSVFNDFPVCYQDSATDSFKTYLAMFDYLFGEGQAEINQLKDWMRLDTNIPAFPFLKRNKDLLLDMLDKIYGENSNPYFFRLEDEGENRKRRVRFLQRLPELLQIRFQAANLLDNTSMSGLEAYLAAIMGITAVEDRIFIIENTLLLPPCVISIPDSREATDLSVVIPYMKQARTCPEFRARIEMFVRERIPAHLLVGFYWLSSQEMDHFIQYYKIWREAWSKRDTATIYWLGESLIDYLRQINSETKKKNLCQ